MKEKVFNKLQSSVECYYKGKKILAIPYTADSTVRIYEADNHMVAHLDNAKIYFTGISLENATGKKVLISYFYNGLCVGSTIANAR